MIRTAQKTDMEQLLQIWLNSNIDAHDFIPQKYWIDNYPLVADQLPQADIYLYEADGNTYGFVGVMDGYIARNFCRQGPSFGRHRQAAFEPCQSIVSHLVLRRIQKKSAGCTLLPAGRLCHK